MKRCGGHTRSSAKKPCKTQHISNYYFFGTKANGSACLWSDLWVFSSCGKLRLSVIWLSAAGLTAKGTYYRWYFFKEQYSSSLPMPLLSFPGAVGNPPVCQNLAPKSVSFLKTPFLGQNKQWEPLLTIMFVPDWFLMWPWACQASGQPRWGGGTRPAFFLPSCMSLHFPLHICHARHQCLRGGRFKRSERPHLSRWGCDSSHAESLQGVFFLAQNITSFLTPISPPPKYKPFFVGCFKRCLTMGVEASCLAHTITENWSVSTNREYFQTVGHNIAKNTRQLSCFFYPIMNYLTKTNFIHL